MPVCLYTKNVCLCVYKKSLSVCVYAKKVCLSVYIQRKSVCLCVYKESLSLCVYTKKVCLSVCIQRKSVCLCVCKESLSVCVCIQRKSVCLCVYKEHIEMWKILAVVELQMSEVGLFVQVRSPRYLLKEDVHEEEGGCEMGSSQEQCLLVGDDALTCVTLWLILFDGGCLLYRVDTVSSLLLLSILWQRFWEFSSSTCRFLTTVHRLCCLGY